MASLLGRIWRRDCCCRALILTCGSLLAIGCGGSDSAAPVETAAAPEEQSPPPAAPGPAAPTPPEETPPAAPPGAPGPVEEAPAEPPAPMDPAASPQEATEVADASSAMENPQAAASDEPSDSAGEATTGSWLAGMAAAVMTPSPNQQSAPGVPGAMPPGAPGAPGAVPGNIPGVAGPAEEMIPDEDGLVPGPGQFQGPPGQMEGVPGQPVAGATKAPAKTFEEGTAEYAVQQLVVKMSAGTTDGMSELINADTKDEILAPLRDGTASPAKIKEAQELVQGIKLSGKREAGSTRLFYARNGAGKSLTFSVRRDDKSGDFRVNSLKIEIPRTRRRR